MQCLILAGGLGTRMRPLTETVPKALLPVAGRPFADWQLQWLAGQGVERVVYSLGHLGEAVETHVGDGRSFGLEVRYCYERDGLLGTAGAVRAAIDSGLMDDAFFVLYGDSYLSVDVGAVQRTFEACNRPALMTVYRNRGAWETSNAVFRNGVVERYDKFTDDRTGMEFIDYGLLALTRAVIDARVPSGAACDLAPVLNALSLNGELAGYEATERFYEVGSPTGINDLEAHLAAPRPTE
jgi:NDP-sugar pyrophosphorylase family protein